MLGQNGVFDKLNLTLNIHEQPTIIIMLLLLQQQQQKHHRNITIHQKSKHDASNLPSRRTHGLQTGLHTPTEFASSPK
jgi:hypothetical protein